MGEVWTGRHVALRLPVAVKVITAGVARDPDYLRGFRREVRATAGMSHPGIVSVLDHGALPEGAEAHSDGRLVAGSPYLVMEFASGGSLADAAARGVSFGQLARVLRDLLDALGHAHARGVVHRDLKPQNVLICTSADARPGLKLTDFGLALGRDDADESVAGTAHYMSPEQVAGDWRAFGPWTDLYALGVIAWRMCCGRLPFSGLKGPALLYAQQHRTPPEFEPQIELPRHFPAWIARLLEKDPARRFACAADALAALDGTTPSFPASWRAPEVGPPPRLRGAGLGLYGLRPVPLVGRHAERDRLWAALREVAGRRQPGIAVLRGPAGTGKSRLAEWLGNRAQETGVAGYAGCGCDRSDGPLDAIARLVRRLTRAGDLEGGELLDHLASAGDDAPALADWLGGGPPVRFESGAERRGPVVRLLGRIARERPLILCIDDAQWGPLPLRLAEELLATEAPVLVVLTVRDEALADLRDSADRIAALQARGQAITVAALPPGDHAQLVRQLLGLAPGLAAGLEQRTAGNPLFAVQIVGDWVQRRLLVAGDTGFELAPGAVLDLPDDLHAVWRRQVDRLVAALPTGAEVALERAAVLGHQVDHGEWIATFDQALPLAALVERLLAVRLATETERGFAFVHGMLRESILRGAAEAGRLAAHHSACAAMLTGRATDDRALSERIGLHLLGAGRPVEAIGPLLDGAVQRCEITGFRSASPLLDAAEQALATVPKADPRWGRLWLERAAVQQAVGDLSGAEDLAIRATRQPVNRGRAWLVLGTIARRRADYERAMVLLGQARGAAGTDRTLEARVVEELARTSLIRSGPVAATRRHWEEAVALYTDLGDAIGRATAETYLALHLNRAGDRRTAEALTRGAQAVFEAKYFRFGVAQCLTQLADFRGEAEDWGEASALYERALGIVDEVGTAESAAIVRLNYATAEMRGGSLARVDRLLDDAWQRMGEEVGPLHAMVHLYRLPGCVFRGDWAAFDAHLEQTLELVGGFANADAAWVAEHAGERALAWGDRERARRAWELARAQWKQFGRPEQVARLEARLGSL